MKLEEVNTRTKEAVDFLVAALESGHSEILTAYLGAMAKFHTYSFGNIMRSVRSSQFLGCSLLRNNDLNSPMKGPSIVDNRRRHKLAPSVCLSDGSMSAMAIFR